jgi:hypothetical protein
MDIHFSDNANTWAATSEQIVHLNKAVFAGSAPTTNGIHTVVLAHALQAFPALIDSLMGVPTLDAAYINACLCMKQQLPKSGSSGLSAYTVSQPNSKGSHDSCNNPMCWSPLGHIYTYCITKGGGMAGKSLNEAHTKKQDDKGKKGGGD